MPRFTRDGLTVETAIPTEAARLRSEGFTESKARTAEVRKAEASKPAEAAKPAEATTSTK